MESDEASTSSEEVSEAFEATPEPEIDEAARAERLKQIRASVEARNARFEALLSLIPPEQFQHLSDTEEPVQKTKKQRKAELAKREKDVKDAKKAIKVERASLKSKGKQRAVEMEEEPVEETPLPQLAPTTTEKPSLTDLRAKLDTKIKALQAARAPTREGLLADRRAKRERQAERKKEERRQARKEAKRAQAATSALSGPVDPPPAPSAEDALALGEVKRARTTVAFGHLDFAPTSAVRAVDTDRKRKSKDARPSASSHDPKQALAALEERQRFLSTHSAEAKERAEDRDKWAAMAARAEGGKVYDDETKLRKAIKKQEKLKKKSKQKWADRQQTVEEAKAAKQQLRAYNLAKRKEEAKRPKGKNKARPGFEGGPAPKRKPPAVKSKAPGAAKKGNPIKRPV